MATWNRTVSNSAGKYCVELDIGGTFTRVSPWYDTSEEAQVSANWLVENKTAAEAKLASIAANDSLDRQLDIPIGEG